MNRRVHLLPGAGHAGRIDALDGLRGVAALSVVIFHFFARWAEPLHEKTLYPHGNLLAFAPALAYAGQFGFLAFFLVSGFVITMTLERCAGLPEFVWRRCARLWPLMIVCATLSTLIINASDIATHFGMARWEVTRLEYFSSIFFLPPDLVSRVLGGGDADWVEGVYWTLWAEVRFYGLAALAFFFSPRDKFIWAWAAIQAASTGIEILRYIDPAFGWPPITLVLQPRYLGWFSIGVCGYFLWTGRGCPPVYLTLSLALLGIAAGEIVTFSSDGTLALAELAPQMALLYLLIFSIFALLLCRSPLVAFFEWRPVTAIGVASYPLYLFHERVGMAGLKFASDIDLAPWLGLVLVLSAVIGSALILHKTVEMPAMRALNRAGRWGRRA